MVARWIPRVAFGVLAGCSEVAVSYDDRPCGSAGTCINGYECNTTTNVCERLCEDQSDCSAGQVCGPTGNICERRCDAFGQCPTGYTCNTTLGACAWSCDAQNNCTDGYICNPASRLCDRRTELCNQDVDADGAADCIDGCIDIDGDGFGQPGGSSNTCIGPDCSVNASTCNVDCTSDLDADEVFDCLDVCIDSDSDGYGINGGAGTCSGTDCNDGIDTCATDCTTNVDNDGMIDCADTCIDPDGDGYGTAGGAGNTCTGPDCGEGIFTCTVDCTTDLDADTTPDCADACLDFDGDGYGTAGGAGNTCTGPDCNENYAACAADCTLCPPAALVLTAGSPVALCATSNLGIDLDGATGAVADLSCAAPAVPLPASNDADRIADFSGGGDDGWLRGGGVANRTWSQDTFPAACPTSAANNYMRFDDAGTRNLDLVTPVNATGYGALVLSFLAGYASAPENGEHLTVYYCCGAGCTPTTVLGTVPNLSEAGGTNSCRTVTMNLPVTMDNCASLDLRFEYVELNNDNNDRAGVDDVTLTGRPLFTPPSEVGGGTYSSSVTSCVANTLDITCTWDNGVNPSLAGTAAVVFQ